MNPAFSNSVSRCRCLILLCLLASNALSTNIAPVAAAPAAPKVQVRGQPVWAVGFELLAAFNYSIVDAGSGATPEQIASASARDQIPLSVHAFDQQRIILTGYMMPVRLEGRLIRTFVMMKDTTTCCYGATPNMNDYVVVTMKGPAAPAVIDVPVRVVGILHVGEKREDGYLVSLYDMDGEFLLQDDK